MSDFKFLGSFLGKGSNFSKDGHDVSNKEALSMPFGVNMPVAYRYVVPNEHYKCRFGMYTQTAPMREDNFAELYNNLCGCYVPLSTVWRNYTSVTQADRSTRMDAVYDVPQYAPTFHLNELIYNWVIPMYFTHAILSYVRSNYADLLPYSVARVSASGTTYGYFYKDPVTGTERSLFSEEDMRHPAVMYFITALQGTASNPDCPVLDIINSLSNYRTSSGSLLCFDVLRVLDQLGFGNWIPFCEKALNWLFTKNASEEIEDLDPIFYIKSTSTGRDWYINTFGFSDGFLDGWINQQTAAWPRVVSPLINICFAYANDALFRSNYRTPSQRVWTWDFILQLYHRGHVDTNEAIKMEDGMLALHFPPVTLTWFTETRGNLEGFYNQPSRFNAQNPLKLEFALRLFTLICPLLQPDVFTTSQLTVVQGSVPTSTTNELTDNLIQTIADKTALYKLRQDLLRAGVRRDKQNEVMFGVSNDNDLMQDCYILDKTYNRVDIQSLLNQAETSEAPLGARGARGNGSSYLDFEFHSKDFGWVFIIGNFTCETYYENFGLDFANTLYPTSWFNPRFNYLGLEAVPHFVLSLFNKNYDADSMFNTPSNVGFSARDWYLKQKVNKVHGLFTNYPLPQPYTYASRYHSRIELPFMRGNAYFGGFLPSVIDQQTALFSSASLLTYNPYMVNNLFTEMFDGVLNGDFSFDHFRCIFNFEVHKVSPFPKLGLLRLD